MAIDIELIQACQQQGQTIIGLTHGTEVVSGPRLLLTLAGLESTFGRDRTFVRAEPPYMPGGRYYKASANLRAEWRKWGVLAASSYGSFQVMYPTARELGFDGHPIQLQDDMVCAYWAARLITQRFIRRHGAKTLRDALDGYNSGNHFDINQPEAYIAKGLQMYHDVQPL